MSTAVARLLGWTAVADWVPKAAAAGLVLVVAAVLGPAEFGVYALAQAWVTYGWSAVDLGTGSYGVRLVAQAGPRRREEMYGLLGLNLVLAALVTAVVVAVVVPQQSRVAATVLAMLAYVAGYAAFPDWYLRGTERFRELAVANVAAVVGWGAAVAFCVATGRTSSVAFGACWALGPVVAAAYAWARLRISPGAVARALDAGTFRRHLGTSWKFAAAGVLSGSTIPLALLAARAAGDPARAGAYALGVRLAAMTAGAMWIGLTNALAALLRRTEQEVGRLTLLASAGGLAVSAVLMLGAALASPLLGSSYATHRGWLVAGLAVLVAWSLKYPVEARLIAAHRDVARIVVGLTGLLVLGAAALLAVAQDDARIAAAGYVAGETAAAVAGLVMLSRRRSRRTASAPG